MGTNNFNPRPTSTLQFDFMPDYDEAGEAYPIERMDVYEFVTSMDTYEFVEVDEDFGEGNDFNTSLVVFDNDGAIMGLVTFETGYYEGVRIHYKSLEFMERGRDLIERYGSEEDVIEFVTGVPNIDFDTLEALLGYNWPERIRDIVEAYGVAHEAEDLFD